MKLCLQWIITTNANLTQPRPATIKHTGMVASKTMFLGAHVKRVNCGWISSVVHIGLLTSGSTSAWVTFKGFRIKKENNQ